MSIEASFERNGDVVGVFVSLNGKEPQIVGSWNLATDEGKYLEVFEVSSECIMTQENRFWKWVCYMQEMTGIGGLSQKKWREMLEEVG